MNCKKCDKELSIADFSMFGPICTTCRAPVLTLAEREAKDAAWRAMMERIVAMPDPNGEAPSAAPPLGPDGGRKPAHGRPDANGDRFESP